MDGFEPFVLYQLALAVVTLFDWWIDFEPVSASSPSLREPCLIVVFSCFAVMLFRLLD